jgi:hypothetical protein
MTEKFTELQAHMVREVIAYIAKLPKKLERTTFSKSTTYWLEDDGEELQFRLMTLASLITPAYIVEMNQLGHASSVHIEVTAEQYGQIWSMLDERTALEDE